MVQVKERRKPARKPKARTLPHQPFGVPLYGYEHPGCL